MVTILSISGFLIMILCGYWVMDIVDRFLTEHITTEEEQDEPENSEPA